MVFQRRQGSGASSNCAAVVATLKTGHLPRAAALVTMLLHNLGNLVLENVVDSGALWLGLGSENTSWNGRSTLSALTCPLSSSLASLDFADVPVRVLRWATTL